MKQATVTPKRAHAILSRMKSTRIMVIGDIMLDEYLWGSVSRISPEAPVPVVEIGSSTEKLGGAANVALNISSIGPAALCVGLCGTDEAGLRMRALMRTSGLSDRSLVATPGRPTTLKTRIMAQHQQIVRTDREGRAPLSPEESDALLYQVRKMAGSVQAAVFSDYAKGVLTQPFLSKAIDLCRRKGVFVAVDPKKHDFSEYAGADLITPNLKEAHVAMGLAHHRCTIDEIRTLGWKLADQTSVAHLLITMGEDGMALFEKSHRHFTHLPTAAQHVFDVTGAGDTVISVFTSAVAAGATPLEAAFLANHSAGLTVAEVGTAVVNPDMLLKAIAT